MVQVNMPADMDTSSVITLPVSVSSLTKPSLSVDPHSVVTVAMATGREVIIIRVRQKFVRSI